MDGLSADGGCRTGQPHCPVALMSHLSGEVDHHLISEGHRRWKIVTQRTAEFYDEGPHRRHLPDRKALNRTGPMR
jgi:hypothetical protein